MSLLKAVPNRAVLAMFSGKAWGYGDLMLHVTTEEIGLPSLCFTHSLSIFVPSRSACKNTTAAMLRTPSPLMTDSYHHISSRIIGAATPPTTQDSSTRPLLSATLAFEAGGNTADANVHSIYYVVVFQPNSSNRWSKCSSSARSHQV